MLTYSHKYECIKIYSLTHTYIYTRVTFSSVLQFAEMTEVEFAPLTAQVIEAYVKTGEPMDKAGKYFVIIK